jgi:hypothetical protein
VGEVDPEAISYDGDHQDAQHELESVAFAHPPRVRDHLHRGCSTGLRRRRIVNVVIAASSSAGRPRGTPKAALSSAEIWPPFGLGSSGLSD